MSSRDAKWDVGDIIREEWGDESRHFLIMSVCLWETSIDTYECRVLETGQTMNITPHYSPPNMLRKVA